MKQSVTKKGKKGQSDLSDDIQSDSHDTNDIKSYDNEKNVTNVTKKGHEDFSKILDDNMITDQEYTEIYCYDMPENVTKKGKKGQKGQDNKYTCELCDFYTNKKDHYDKHLITKKHMKKINNKITDNNVVSKTQCSCGVIFNNRTTLWRHKQMCKIVNKENAVNNDLMKLLIQDTNDFKKLIMKIVENGTYNNNTNINNSSIHNSNNKTFNLHVFLNETCKDAMNIMDFVNSINITLDEFEKVGDLGYVEGLSNIIVKNLNKLDVTKRPIHCTDKKREILYIKDDNKWEKENKNNDNLRKMIKHVAHKNAKLLLTFREKHPDCNKSHSKFSDQYTKLTIESMGGSGDNDIEKEDKIIKNISKIVTIDKLSGL